MKQSQLVDIVTNITKSYKNKLDKSAIKDIPIINDPESEDIIRRFPYMNDTLVDLMSVDYKLFINKIEWIAPKPSTFRVTLKNGNYFFLTWGGKEFSINISGLDFDLGSLSDELRAIKQIKNALIYGPFNRNEDDNINDDLEKTAGSVGGASSGDTTPNPFGGSAGFEGEDDLFDAPGGVEGGEEEEIPQDDSEEIDVEL